MVNEQTVQQVIEEGIKKKEYWSFRQHKTPFRARDVDAKVAEVMKERKKIVDRRPVSPVRRIVMDEYEVAMNV